MAWLTPEKYVLAVAQQATLPALTLKLFTWDCEFDGSVPLYSGKRLDASYEEAEWSLLALDDHRVLAIGNGAAARMAFAGAKGAPWLLVDVRNGSISRTEVMWDGTRAWAAVMPSAPFRFRATPVCGGPHWTWP